MCSFLQVIEISYCLSARRALVEDRRDFQWIAGRFNRPAIFDIAIDGCHHQSDGPTIREFFLTIEIAS
jgi:hypothetical protein